MCYLLNCETTGRRNAHGPEQVFRRQLLFDSRNFKTFSGDAQPQSEWLPIGFEPNPRNGFSPVLQSRPLLRGRLFGKVHVVPHFENQDAELLAIQIAQTAAAPIQTGQLRRLLAGEFGEQSQRRIDRGFRWECHRDIGIEAHDRRPSVIALVVFAANPPVNVDRSYSSSRSSSASGVGAILVFIAAEVKHSITG